jgi:hypothetical protein
MKTTKDAGVENSGAKEASQQNMGWLRTYAMAVLLVWV